MTVHRSFTGPLLLTALAGLSACGGSDDDATSEPAPATASQPFSTTPDEPNHEEITALGLSFLRADILAAFQAANVATDVEYALQNANHFDDCNFTGGSQVVQSNQADAVAQLNPKTSSPETDLLAIRAFARSLHALQDFYAHTNWVELGGQAIVDDSLGPFRTLNPYTAASATGFLVIQGNPPKRATVTREAAAAYPTSAVVTIADGKKRAPGLMSGTVDYEEGNFCPDSVSMTHEELNKDKSSLADRVEQHEAAKALAILQTEHEWCRLRTLTRAKWREAGVARLDTWVAKGAAAPTCERQKPPPPTPPKLP